MRALCLIITISIHFSSCVLLAPQKEVRLNLPDDSPLYLPGQYRIYSINDDSRWEQDLVVYLDGSMDLLIEKEGLTFVQVTPLQESPQFQPCALGFVIDPQQDLSIELSEAGGVSSELYIRLQDTSLPFNYLRFQLQVGEKLGNQAWRMDLDELCQRVVEGHFSSRYIRKGDEIPFPVIFPPGRWVAEDPSLGSWFSDGELPWEIPLRPQSGIRFMNRQSRTVLEFYCTAEGRLLRMNREY